MRWSRWYVAIFVLVPCMTPTLRTAQSADWQGTSTVSTDWCAWRGLTTQDARRNSLMDFPPVSGCWPEHGSWKWPVRRLFPLSWAVTCWNWEFSRVLTWADCLMTVMRLSLMGSLEHSKMA